METGATAPDDTVVGDLSQVNLDNMVSHITGLAGKKSVCADGIG